MTTTTTKKKENKAIKIVLWLKKNAKKLNNKNA
jgi:hypothetical protein